MCLMCGCGTEDFMGSRMPNQNVYDVGPGQLSSPAMFGTDSMNPLGAEAEEGMAHEMSEPRGEMGEDID
jgi:hypothetical protein